MHIPDGYLSPATAVLAYGVALPFWYQASKRVKETLRSQAAPLVPVFAALSFTVQMFNIPVPWGTTAHAVGGTLMAVVLGPWAAVVGVSSALIIQALFFGDGGITAIGANSFNMGIALPLVGYAVYKLLAGRSPSHRRRIVAATIASYVGINVAGLLTALWLGIQPIFWTEYGRALYSPYGLETTVPAMALVHLTIAGFAEAAFTGLSLAYILRTHPTLLEGLEHSSQVAGQGLGRAGWGLAGLLLAMVVLTPLGLLAPGVAEFEWGAGEVEVMVGYLPAGLQQMGGLWGLTPLGEYQLPGAVGDSVMRQAPGYILSAVVGIGLLFVLALGARVALGRRDAASRGG